jgi:hypothetical protein
MVAPGDPHATAGGLRSLIVDREAAAALGRRAADAARAWDPTAMTAAYLSRYAELTARDDAARPGVGRSS